MSPRGFLAGVALSGDVSRCAFAGVVMTRFAAPDVSLAVRCVGCFAAPDLSLALSCLGCCAFSDLSLAPRCGYSARTLRRLVSTALSASASRSG